MLNPAPHRFFEGGALPSAYSARGSSVTFKTDFRPWLKFERLREETGLTGEEFVAAAVALCCGRTSGNPGADFIMDGILWFHSCADVERSVLPKDYDEGTAAHLTERARNRPRLVNLYWDFFQLWGSFKKQHGIDLYTCGEMHWWEFRRLYDELKDDTGIAQLALLRRPMSEEELLGGEKGEKKRKKRQLSDYNLDRFLLALPK